MIDMSADVVLAKDADRRLIDIVRGDGNLPPLMFAIATDDMGYRVWQYFTSPRVHYSTATGAGQGEIVMDDRQILKNMVDVIRLMDPEQKERVRAFAEGMKFMLTRQAEQSAER